MLQKNLIINYREFILENSFHKIHFKKYHIYFKIFIVKIMFKKSILKYISCVLKFLF